MEELIRQIKHYERQAGSIEPDAGRRQELLTAVNGYIENFLETLPARPAYIDAPDKGRGLYDSPISERGVAIEEALRLYREHVDYPGLNLVSGKFFGYIPPCSMYYSALGDYLAAVTDEFSGNFDNSPGAVRMEHQLVRWMTGLFGYPKDTALGILTSGGSIATIACLTTAREMRGLKAKRYEKAVVYATRFTHHCVKKALHIIGMTDCVKREVATDAHYRLDSGALARAIVDDRNQGLEPWLVVGSAGTTDLGNVDQLDRISVVAKEYGLWLHVDGAYGGFFILSDLARDRFAGIESTDSVVVNPHKGLHTPFGLGAALVRDGEQLYKAHFHTANYLQDDHGDKEEYSPSDLGPELTRHFRALRLWLPLKLIGVAPFRAMLSEKLLLTRYAYQRFKSLDGFEVGPEPELSIFVFRYVAGPGDPDEFNQKLLEALRRDGTIFLTSTRIDGAYMLRFAVLSYRTHIDTVDLAVEVILREIAKLLGPASAKP